MTSINKKTVCGILGGKPFLEVDRVNPLDKKCLAGMARCSNVTNDENSICYPKDRLDDFCPVTGIVFYKKDSQEEKDMLAAGNLTDGWKKMDVYDGYVMYYTKTDVDSLPITSTKLAFRPCMHPHQVETSPENDFYNLEN